MRSETSSDREATAAEVLEAMAGRDRIGLSALRKVLGTRRTRAATFELMRAGKIRRDDGGAIVVYELVTSLMSGKP